MWVTCYTDASFSRRQGGSWAVWIRSAGGRVVRRGACPAYVRDSFAAELAAIFAGLFLAATTWKGNVTGVLVCSDCLGALDLITRPGANARNPGARRLCGLISRLLSSNGIELSCRWVRGHQRANSSTAAFLNNRCDRLARQHRLGLDLGRNLPERAPGLRILPSR
jgi:ribonuclease HI